MENNYESRISKAEVKLEQVEKEVSKIDSLQEAIITLTTIQKSQEERDKKFKVFYEEQLKINTEVYSSLKAMNDNFRELKDDVNIVKGDINELKSNAMWNWQKFVKAIIPTLITGGVIYAIMQLI